MLEYTLGAVSFVMIVFVVPLLALERWLNRKDEREW